MSRINQEVLCILDGLIRFKTEVLNSVLSCKMFTANYPLLIEHIRREAKLYRKQLMLLECGRSLRSSDIRELELFWDRIMMEHALFIRGLLDPTEEDLIKTSDEFAEIFKDLLKEACEANDFMISEATNRTLEEVKRIRDFKTAGVEGLNNCEIKSIIVPLLADHVLREANHFIRILKMD